VGGAGGFRYVGWGLGEERVGMVVRGQVVVVRMQVTGRAHQIVIRVARLALSGGKQCPPSQRVTITQTLNHRL
jgi:hypothetical protein